MEELGAYGRRSAVVAARSPALSLPKLLFFIFLRAYSLARLTSLNKELFSNDFDQIAIVKVLHKVTKFEHHTNQSR